MCTNNFGKAELSSMLANQKSLPQRPSTGRIVPGYKQVVNTVIDGVLTCEFCRKLTVPAESQMFMYDLTIIQYYGVYAAGGLTGSVERYHGSGTTNRDTSITPLNLRRYVVRRFKAFFSFILVD